MTCKLVRHDFSQQVHTVYFSFNQLLRQTSRLSLFQMTELTSSSAWCRLPKKKSLSHGLPWAPMCADHHCSGDATMMTLPYTCLEFCLWIAPHHQTLTPNTSECYLLFQWLSFHFLSGEVWCIISVLQHLTHISPHLFPLYSGPAPEVLQIWYVELLLPLFMTGLCMAFFVWSPLKAALKCTI